MFTSVNCYALNKIITIDINSQTLINIYNLVEMDLRRNQLFASTSSKISMSKIFMAFFLACGLLG